jgi:hypothetical protein
MVTAGVGMHFRQKHPPHMSILEKRGLMSVPCFSHEKNPLPSFSPILCLAMTLCKAYYRASATLRRTSAVPPPHVASRSKSVRQNRCNTYCCTLSSACQPANRRLAATINEQQRIKRALKKGVRNRRDAFGTRANKAITSVPPIDNRKRVPPPPVTIPRTRRRTHEPIFPADLPSPLIISET